MLVNTTFAIPKYFFISSPTLSIAYLEQHVSKNVLDATFDPTRSAVALSLLPISTEPNSKSRAYRRHIC